MELNLPVSSKLRDLETDRLGPNFRKQEHFMGHMYIVLPVVSHLKAHSEKKESTQCLVIQLLVMSKLIIAFPVGSIHYKLPY
jgi:hypothetical protein